MIVEGPVGIGTTLRAVWKPLVFLTVVNVVVTLTYKLAAAPWLFPQDVPLPLVGTGLVVFLGLRNSTAYARWWEARTLWGAIVNQSRNLARTVCSVLRGPGHAPLRSAILLHQIAWASALRHALRREDVVAELDGALPAGTLARLAGASNVPFAIQREIADLVGDALGDGAVDSIQFADLNGILGALTDAQGGLERIRNTPMPHHYTTLPRLFVMVYGALLPFGVVNDLGWLTPFGCTLIGALFLTLDRAGANLENPFARSVHDLPMSALCRTIEIDLKQAAGYEDHPAPPRAVLGILR